MTELRCIHRHTIKEHPSCFRRGLIKGGNPRANAWYNNPQYLIGYLDIETDNLYADFGTMLSWCIKQKEGPVFYSTISKEELFNGTYDKRLLKDLLKTMKRFKIIVGYNSTLFDIPFIRTKALHYNMDFPAFQAFDGPKGGFRLEPEIYHWDIYFTAKSKLRLTRKSLDSVCDYLNIEGKTPIDKDVWRRAKYGDPEALESVLKHNIGDVEILETLHGKLEPFRKWAKTGV